ncbi:MAG: hypothetical protein WDN76_01510 [Alphaproteobacteria bacterium]
MSVNSPINPVSPAIRMNRDGSTSPRGRVFPAREDLIAVDIARFELHERLKVRHDLVVPDRNAQIALPARRAPERGRPASKNAKPRGRHPWRGTALRQRGA